jgi:hypothetical protein
MLGMGRFFVHKSAILSSSSFNIRKPALESAGFPVAFRKMQFLQPLECPEGEIDLDTVRVEDLSIEIV